MFHKAVTKDTKSKRELRQIGQRLRHLIQQNDAESLAEALNIIEAHQNDSEVINAQRFHQSTPLILACELGKKKIAKKLLAAKCIDVNRTGHKNENPLETALKSKQFKIAYLLANDARVNINAMGADGIHPAFRALEEFSKCPFVIAKTIISRPDMDLTSVYDHTSGDFVLGHHYHYRTILHSLVRELNRSKWAARLAERVQEYEIMAIENKNHEEGLALLKQVLATGMLDVNAFEIDHLQHHTKEKTTALMRAASNHMPEVVSILLAAGADPELQNENGVRAADIAKAHSLDTDMYGKAECQVAHEIYEMIKGFKPERVMRRSSLSMFASLNNIPDVQPALPQYLEPPKPSAPPAEDVNVDTSMEKSVMRI